MSIYFFDIHINTTSSIPIGIYTLNRNTNLLRRNHTILFCLKNEFTDKAKTRGYLPVGMCKNGLAPIGKKVIAASHDRVIINKEGIYVNGELLPNTKPMQYDGNGLPLNHSKLNRLLTKDEYLVASIKEDSFDSRYYGIVDRKDILGILKELVVIKNYPA